MDVKADTKRQHPRLMASSNDGVKTQHALHNVCARGLSKGMVMSKRLQSPNMATLMPHYQLTDVLIKKLLFCLEMSIKS